MTVAEIIKQEKGNYNTFEIYQYSDKTRRLHNDFIENLDGIYDMSYLENLEVEDYQIMDEEEYDATICANGCIRADFTKWYDDANAKILVIMIDYFVDIE